MVNNIKYEILLKTNDDDVHDDDDDDDDAHDDGDDDDDCATTQTTSNDRQPLTVIIVLFPVILPDTSISSHIRLDNDHPRPLPLFTFDKQQRDVYTELYYCHDTLSRMSL